MGHVRPQSTGTAPDETTLSFYRGPRSQSRAPAVGPPRRCPRGRRNTRHPDDRSGPGFNGIPPERPPVQGNSGLRFKRKPGEITTQTFRGDAIPGWLKRRFPTRRWKRPRNLLNIAGPDLLLGEGEGGWSRPAMFTIEADPPIRTRQVLGGPIPGGPSVPQGADVDIRT